MILCDTGPLVALVHLGDADHLRCLAALEQLPAEMFVTTWPCLTEAMHLLSRAGGGPARDVLWGYLADGLVKLHLPTEEDWRRIEILTRQYHDVPMDLADASLVLAAEQLGLRRIFTLDHDFFVYRIHGTGSFEVIP